MQSILLQTIKNSYHGALNLSKNVRIFQKVHLSLSYFSLQEKLSTSLCLIQLQYSSFKSSNDKPIKIKQISCTYRQ